MVQFIDLEREPLEFEVEIVSAAALLSWTDIIMEELMFRRANGIRLIFVMGLACFVLFSQISILLAGQKRLRVNPLFIFL